MQANSSTPPHEIDNMEAQLQIESADRTPVKKNRVRKVAPSSFRVPDDWEEELRPRTSGKYTGKLEKFYYEPKSGKQFRSLVSVWEYMERNAKEIDATPEASKLGDHSKALQTSKPYSTNVPRKKMRTSSFDFAMPPEKITWILTDPASDEWNPFVGETMVPEPVKNLWAETFVSVMDGNVDPSVNAEE